MDMLKIDKEVNYLLHENLGAIALLGSVFLILSRSSNLDEKELKQIETGKNQLKKLNESLDYFYKQMQNKELVK